MGSIRIYDMNEYKFDHNGICTIKPTKCEITRNLYDYLYFLNLTYPLYIDNKWKELVENRIIHVKDERFDDYFRIVKTTKTDYEIEVYCEHVFFDLEKNFIENLEISPNTKGNSAIQKILNSTKFSHHFTGTSNITRTGKATIVGENVISALIGDGDNTFLHGWSDRGLNIGVELDMNKFTFALNDKIGIDSECIISYGKNLSSISCETDFSQLVTQIMPVGDDNIMLDEKYVSSSKINKYPNPVIKKIKYDFIKCKESPNYSGDGTDAYDTMEQAKAELKRLAQLEFSINKVDEPLITFNINFIDLSRTEEYKNYKKLLSLNIGDTVYIRHRLLDIDITARVVEYTYDFLSANFNNVTLGNNKRLTLSELYDTNKKFSKIKEETKEETKEEIYNKFDDKFDDFESNINTKIDNYDDEIADLQKQITSNDNDITNINEDITDIYKRLGTIITGDSDIEGATGITGSDGISGILFISPTGGDDTEMIQKAVNTGKHIYSVARATYKVTQPIRVNHSNQIIDFNNSIINFAQDQNKPHTTGSSRTNDVGVFDLKGYSKSSSTSISSTYLAQGIFTVSSTSGLSLGDFVEIKITSSGYSSSKLTPRIHVLAQVIGFSGNQVYTDYSCSCWKVSNSGTMTKIIPQKNVIVRNMTINDNTTKRSNSSDNYSAENSHYACCGVGIAYATNIVVENIIHNRGMFSTIHSTCCHNCKFRNLTANNPRLTGGGEGYCIQNISFNNIIIENIVGLRTRHTIDFSCGGHASARNITSMFSTTSDIQLHGQYEHDIVIENLHGSSSPFAYPYFNAGSGTDFGNASANITFRNSELAMICSKDIQYTQRLSFENCRVLMHRATGDVYFSNCYIQMQDFGWKTYTRRGGVASKLSILNSTVEIMSTSQCVGQYDQVEIIGGKIINDLGKQVDVILDFYDCLDINIQNVTKLECGIRISNDATTYGNAIRKTNISGCNFYCYRYAGIWLKDDSASRHITTICNNNFVKSSMASDSANPYCIDFDGQYAKTSDVKFIAIGNNAPHTRHNINGLQDNNKLAYCKCINNIGIADYVFDPNTTTT